MAVNKKSMANLQCAFIVFVRLQTVSSKKSIKSAKTQTIIIKIQH